MPPVNSSPLLHISRDGYLLCMYAVTGGKRRRGRRGRTRGRGRGRGRNRDRGRGGNDSRHVILVCDRSLSPSVSPTLLPSCIYCPVGKLLDLGNKNGENDLIFFKAQIIFFIYVIIRSDANNLVSWPNGKARKFIRLFRSSAII